MITQIPSKSLDSTALSKPRNRLARVERHCTRGRWFWARSVTLLRCATQWWTALVPPAHPV